MSYPEISGLDLFEMPFCKPQASGQQADRQSWNATEPAPQPGTQAPAPLHANGSGTRFPNPQEQRRSNPAKRETQPETPVPEIPQAQQPDAPPAPPSQPKAPADTPKPEAPPKKELVLDIPSDPGTTGEPKADDDAAKRRAHEEAEAKRRAQWEAKQLKKKQDEESAIQKLMDMSDADAIAESVKRVSADMERLTRRNMKECVAARIQDLARRDPAFARRTMHPRKSMVNCFRYINRLAKEYLRQEMEDNDIRPENGVYGGDVPDGLCYQWAEDYFRATDAPEDRREEETFTPKPYVGTTTPKAKPKKETKSTKKKSEKNQESKPEFEQMSFL